MGRYAGKWMLAGCVVGLCAAEARAQSFGQPLNAGAGLAAQPNVAAAAAGMPGAGGTPGVYGTALANPYVNPYANPYMNPFLNPYMTQFPGNRNDNLLYFVAAQQARGLGASTNLGASRSGRLGSAGATGAPGAPGRMPAGRVAPSRPAPNQRVSGRFDSNPYFNDARGRLASRYPAYGAAAANAETGGRVTPAGSPAPNETALGRYYNRYPSSTRNNGR